MFLIGCFLLIPPGANAAFDGNLKDSVMLSFLTALSGGAACP
jgi:hypothetical protein